MRLFSSIALLAAASLMVGCGSTPMQMPTPSFENTVKLRNASLAPAAVGDFTLAQGQPASKEKSVKVRGRTLYSPIDQSYSKYLKETLNQELKAAHLLDANSTTQISGFLVDSDADAPIGTGNGFLTARFVVTRDGQVAYDRQLSTKLEWDSSFVAAIAIPTAARNYSFLYKKLVGDLFDDPDFRQALAK